MFIKKLPSIIDRCVGGGYLKKVSFYMKSIYIQAITEKLNSCEDIELLDLILKLLDKSEQSS